MEYTFDWDPKKAALNLRNHGIGFERAATMFLDQERSEAVRDRRMKKEYNFSEGVRGKFYRPDTELRLPVYLEPASAAFLRKLAEAKGTDVQQIVNDLIRRDIDLIKSVG